MNGMFEGRFDGEVVKGNNIPLSEHEITPIKEVLSCYSWLLFVVNSSNICTVVIFYFEH